MLDNKDQEPGAEFASAPQVPQQQTISLDNINGRLAELAEVNQMLTGRLAIQRGVMADMSRTIQTQAAEIARLKAMKPKRNGRS